MTYTNEGDYYYKEYDKAVANAMPFAISIINVDDSIHLEVAVGNYTVRTPNVPVNWNETMNAPEEYSLIMPLFFISGSDSYEDDDENTYIYAFDIIRYIYGYYDFDHDTGTNIVYSYIWYDAEWDYEDDGSFSSSYQSDMSFPESTVTVGDIVKHNEDDEEPISYTSILLLSSEGDYVIAKNPVFDKSYDILPFTSYTKFDYSKNRTYSSDIAIGGDSEWIDVFYHDKGSQYSRILIQDCTSELAQSTIGNNIRMDGVSIKCVKGTSSYLQMGIDVYAIVPKTVEYTLASGTNEPVTKMKYYETTPTVDITIAYEYEIDEYDDIVVNVVTLTYGNHTIVWDRAVVFERFKDMDTLPEEEARTLYQGLSTIWVLADVALNEDSSTQSCPWVISLGQGYPIDSLPTNISISPTGITVTTPSETNEYTRADSPCYLIDETGTYGVMMPTEHNPVYVIPDILDYKLPLYSPFTYGLGWMYIYNYNGPTSMYDSSRHVADSPSIQITDGKMTDIMYSAGYRSDGSTTDRVGVGMINALAVLSLSADNGPGDGNSGSSSNDLGTTGTILTVIPIFVILSVLMYAVTYLKDYRKAI